MEPKSVDISVDLFYNKETETTPRRQI